VNARVKKESANISITAQITNIDHLQKLLYKLEHLKEVRTVYRVTKREARVGGTRRRRKLLNEVALPSRFDQT